MTNYPTTVAGILLAAADRIRRHGWCQHQPATYDRSKTGDKPAACAYYAIITAAQANLGNAHYAVLAVAEYLDAADDLDTMDIQDLADIVTNWNDASHQSAETVTTVLRKAADRWHLRHTSGGDQR
jgi:hypothetical protein